MKYQKVKTIKKKHLKSHQKKNQKKKKNLGITLTNIIKLKIKKTVDDSRKQKHIRCSWIRRTNTVKMAIILNAIHRFKAIPITSPMTFHKIRIILKFTLNHKRHRIAKVILRKKNKAGGIPWADFKQYCRTAVIKTVCHGRKKQTSRSMEWNRVQQ